MNELEITHECELNKEQIASLDTHSLLNIINCLNFELIQLTDIGDSADKFDSFNKKVSAIGGSFSAQELDERHVDWITDELNTFKSEIFEFLESIDSMINSDEIKASRDNVSSIFSVLDVRLCELRARIKSPNKWEPFNIEELTASYTDALGAIEKHSKGRYRIIYNIALHDIKDYYVDLKIESSTPPILYMPPVIQDVFRDLIANARKYTPLGGRISAGIYNDGKHLKLIVEDTGQGIPADEISTVVDYGKRASNAVSTRTMGGGFGLTKAYYVCKKNAGEMWIRSEVGRGTRIKISIPVPDSI